VTRKVLIVDDSKLARMAVIKALNSLHPDWTRLEASDAATALDIVRRESPEIALLDYNMPGKDGLALAAELGRENPQIHVAVISANHQAEVIGRARHPAAGRRQDRDQQARPRGVLPALLPPDGREAAAGSERL
jgi:DNA-binding NarL/FixJ family response regulator